jgi:hypothetical protein|tara:strand:- start:691 stop:816 length:126 start_codon:yes stop_codon:yes gene_type:complete
MIGNFWSGIQNRAKYQVVQYGPKSMNDKEEFNTEIFKIQNR